MKEDIEKRWVEALESGKYKQGKDSLKIQNKDGSFSYCCLGVLCELAVEDGIIKPSSIPEDSFVWTYEDRSGVLPMKVMEWAGLDSCNPVVEDANHVGNLSEDLNLSCYNDGLNYSFKQIAKLIRDSL